MTLTLTGTFTVDSLNSGSLPWNEKHTSMIDTFQTPCICCYIETLKINYQLEMSDDMKYVSN